ncbi:MAG: MBL fold metallo-hydrolase [Candidatus Nucleicultricaceae bacterium]
MGFVVKFWGTRGSIATSHEHYKEFGGNTSCVSVETQNHFFIFDMGTGLRDLGLWMMQHAKKKAHIFVSHLHYDHVIGFPFFQPAWAPDVTLDIFAPRTEKSGTIEHFFGDILMTPPLFPIDYKSLSSKRILHDTKEDLILELDGGEKICVYGIPLNHPGGAMGYRINVDNHAICYISDHEHGITSLDEKLEEFIQEADVVIYDATFTPDEYAQKKGWGHSTYEQGINFARQAGVKRLYLFHHDPSHDDDCIKKIEEDAKKIWPHVEAARQGHSYEVK